MDAIGSVDSITAKQKREVVETAIADGKLPLEIQDLIKGWKHELFSTIRVSASNFVALDTDKKFKAVSKYQFFIQNRTNCRK
ncbi:hypothetical protein [Nostoc sp.]|uniref:hypothetical protein n=1 Tax=Nostoc sp. TaxID=1180 RepID=UPI002FF306E1